MNQKKVYKESVDSVVLILTDYQKGAGFIVRDDGLTLTNHHVVYPTDKVLLECKNGESCDGMVVCSNRSLDLACVYPMNEKIRHRRPLPLGESFIAEVGDPIIAIGHPSNASNFSMIQGFVSAMNITEGKAKELIQLNISGNWGMSGGLLLAEMGK